MHVSPNVASIAMLLHDTSRAAMLTHLLDGRCHPAGDLAAVAGITPQTASFHLAKMIDSGVLTVERHGRHRYYRLSRPADAEIIESFMALSGPVQISSLRQSIRMQELRHARMCYDHLAGQVAVRITESLLNRGFLLKEGMSFLVSASGETFFADYGLDLAAIRKKRRSFARCCLDWTEREHHLAGALGAAVTERMAERQWLTLPEDGRMVEITAEGKSAIARWFGVEI